MRGTRGVLVCAVVNLNAFSVAQVGVLQDECRTVHGGTKTLEELAGSTAHGFPTLPAEVGLKHVSYNCLVDRIPERVDLGDMQNPLLKPASFPLSDVHKPMAAQNIEMSIPHRLSQIALILHATYLGARPRLLTTCGSFQKSEEVSSETCVLAS